MIVGASQAGVELAAALRRGGDTRPIALVGAEKGPPYQRPPLSKTFLACRAEPPSLALRTPEFFAEQAIQLICGERVERLDGSAGGGAAMTCRGRTIVFDRLALAVGARARRLTVPGAGLDGVCHLRDLVGATGLRGRLAAARRVVVVGGGFIGLEVAAVARTLGKDVVVVEAADRLMPRSVAPVVSDHYDRAHRRRGARILVGRGVAALRGRSGRVREVELSDGALIPADVVVVGVGIVPRTELAAQLGLACDGGIVVDALARTSEPGVVAAGDCAALARPGAPPVRLESVPHATSQARVAAATLLGRPAPDTSAPWFWSDQYDLKLQIAGLADGHDAHVVRRGEGESMSVLYYRRGELLAVNAVNKVVDYLAVRRALARGATIPADRAADPDVSLAELARSA